MLLWLKKHKAPALFTLVVVSLIVLFVPFLTSKQIRRSRATGAISDFKDTYIALRDYASNHNGILPSQKGNTANSTLQVLFDEKICVDPLDFDYPFEGHMAYYVSQDGTGYHIENSPANTAIMTCVKNADNKSFNTRSLGGQTAICRIDGSVVAFDLSENGSLPSNTFIHPNRKPLLYQKTSP